MCLVECVHNYRCVRALYDVSTIVCTIIGVCLSLIPELKVTLFFNKVYIRNQFRCLFFIVCSQNFVKFEAY